MKPTVHPGLSIPNPCSMKWNELNPINENHRGCDKCSRVIIDFSRMSDAELVKYLSENRKVCGQFTKQQLDRPLIGEQKAYGFFKLKTLFMLPFLLFGAAVSAKNRNVPMNVVGTEQTDLTEKKQSIDLLSSDILRGTVRESGSQTPIGFATITVINGKDTLTTQSDSAGHFSMNVGMTIAGDSLTLTVMAPGYFMNTRKVSGGEMLDIQMDMEEIMMMGEIEYMPPAHKKHKGH